MDPSKLGDDSSLTHKQCAASGPRLCLVTALVLVGCTATRSPIVTSEPLNSTTGKRSDLADRSQPDLSRVVTVCSTTDSECIGKDGENCSAFRDSKIGDFRFEPVDTLRTVSQRNGESLKEEPRRQSVLRQSALPQISLSPIVTLPELETVALGQNPRLRRFAQEYEAARAKVSHVDGLPDPTIGANLFAAPIETASGSQRANLTVGQIIPWLDRLDAQAQQACFEAMASQQVYAAEKLKVVGDLNSLWCRLYVIGKQIQINEANQQLLESLIEVATARVATGNATQGDVLAGTLEYSKLEEQLVTLRQQRHSVFAQINRLLGRDSDITIVPPSDLQVSLPKWDHPMLKQTAIQHQPDIQAARIRSQATRWGLEVARLKRRPDFSVSASWFVIDNNRPASTVVDVGDDAWSVGASVSIPLWDRKYDALEREARWKHAASYASVEETVQRYDSALRDLWEQAKAADQTALLYQQTILPQAQSTLEADQQSYVNGTVDFDRVISDVRNLITLEIGYHRAIGQLGATLARIQQSVGTPLTF